MKFRKLRADEIEARLSMVTENGCGILLYKDARVDQRILDETVGPMNWQRHHTRDNANCVVSIWDEEKKQWIEKEDTGVASYTEAEKGLASDSFKRACFNWGIGRELYTSPQIWFTDNEANINGKKCYDKFIVTDIQYQDENIASVTVKNTKKGIEKTFSNAKAEQAVVKEGRDNMIAYLQENMPEDRMKKMLEYYKVSEIKFLKQADLTKVYADIKAGK